MSWRTRLYLPGGKPDTPLASADTPVTEVHDTTWVAATHDMLACRSRGEEANRNP